MARATAAIVGAAESKEIGKLPDISQTQLGCEAALAAIADAGLKPSDIDGIASVADSPENYAYILGTKPRWIDGTNVGGCSYLIAVMNAMAALESGLCNYVLIVHGESGRSRIGLESKRASMPVKDLQRQFEVPYGVSAPVNLLTLPALRFMRDCAVTEEHLAAVAVAAREWAAKTPRAFLREPTTIDEVLAARMIAYPFRRPMVCLITDGGAAIVLARAEEARDMPRSPVYVLGGGASLDTMLVGQMEDLTSHGASVRAGRDAFAMAHLRTDDVDHVMIYDAFAHLPLYALQDLGFVARGDAGVFVAEGHTSPGGSLPMNTQGGGLCYTHTGYYGMFTIQESVRQLRGEAAAQLQDVRVSLAHGYGGLFAAATLILSTEL